MKPDCYKCEYRENNPGTTHIQCTHPAFNSVNEDPLLKVFSILAGVGRVAPIRVEAKGINVVGDPHGIKKGWFNHPFSFDPTWLMSCDGYKERIKT